MCNSNTAARQKVKEKNAICSFLCSSFVLMTSEIFYVWAEYMFSREVGFFRHTDFENAIRFFFFNINSKFY